MNPRSISLYLCIHQGPARERTQGSKDTRMSKKYAKPKMLHNVFEINSKCNQLQFRSRAEIENCTLFNAEYSILNHNFVRFLRHLYRCNRGYRYSDFLMPWLQTLAYVYYLFILSQAIIRFRDNTASVSFITLELKINFQNWNILENFSKIFRRSKNGFTMSHFDSK